MTDRSRNILLAVSLAFNVFVVGAIAGGGYVLLQDRPRLQNQGLRFAAAGLSGEQQAAFRKGLREARAAAAASVAAARDGRMELLRLLEADAIDRGAVSRELAAIRDNDMALRERLEGAIIDFAAGLDASDRKTLIEGLRGRGAMIRREPPENK